MRIIPKLAVFSLVQVALMFSVAAQTPRSTVTVNIADALGAVVIGATVTLESPGAKPITATTTANGVAVFRNVSPGEYTFSVSAKGFVDYRSDKFGVRGGETVTRDVALEISPIESEVDVDQTSSVDPETAGAAVVLNREQIDLLPEDEAALARAISALGVAATGEELPISVNGIPGGNLPPRSAIQQIRVNQNVYSAQHESPFGGGIDIITSSRADRYRTWLNYGFANSRFNASDPFIGRRVPFRQNGFYASVSGPLFSKKASFSLSGGFNDTASAASINAIILDGDLSPTTLKKTFPEKQQTGNISLFVNADITKKQKIFFNVGTNASDGSGQGVGGLTLESRATDSRSAFQNARFSHTYLIDPDTVNQFQVNFWRNISESIGNGDGFALNVLDAFLGGASQQNSSNRNIHFSIYNNFTRQIGRYSLAAGMHYRLDNRSQTSLNNFGGTYTFAGRTAPVLDQNNFPVTGPNGTIVTTQINSLEAYRRTLLFRQQGLTPQQIRSLGGGATQFTISSGDPELDARQSDIAFYFQNSYRLSDTLAVSAGLRYERQTNISSDLNFAPRVGFIWSPKFDEKKQKAILALPRISVGYGIFYSRFNLSNTINARLASDTDRRQYLVTEAAILDLFPNRPTIAQLESFALPRTRRQIDPELGTPFQHLIGINITKRLPKKFSMNGSITIARSPRQTVTRNINAPLAGTWDPLNPLAAVRPFGNVGNIYETRSISRLETERYSVGINLPQSQTLYGSIRYSYARSRGDGVSGSGSRFDPYDFSYDLGPNAGDGVHGMSGYLYYTFRKTTSVGTDFGLSSGQRFNITTGRDSNGDSYFTERPSFASDPNKPGVIATKYGLLDPNPAVGDRIIPRNLGRGRPSFYFNASLSRQIWFNMDEKTKRAKQILTFTVRANNLFNVINKGLPIGNMTSPNFLQTISGQNDFGVVFYNGIQQPNFPGRSLAFGTSLSF